MSSSKHLRNNMKALVSPPIRANKKFGEKIHLISFLFFCYVTSM